MSNLKLVSVVFANFPCIFTLSWYFYGFDLIIRHLFLTPKIPQIAYEGESYGLQGYPESAADQV